MTAANRPKGMTAKQLRKAPSGCVVRVVTTDGLMCDGWGTGTVKYPRGPLMYRFAMLMVYEIIDSRHSRMVWLAATDIRSITRLELVDGEWKEVEG